MSTKVIEFSDVRLVTTVERGRGFSYSIQFINSPLEGLSMDLSEREYIRVLENLIAERDDVTVDYDDN